jgi:GntR family transcriptional repressor for pyruvate dehydrogenase complex
MLTTGTSAPVRTRSDLVSILTEQISRGDVAEGQLLPSERQLAEEFGLSRSMVREALRTLSERRLIDIIPGRGSVVLGTNVSNAVEHLITLFDHGGVTPRYLIEARSMIETTAAAQAAERATADGIGRIWHAVNACNAATALLDKVSLDLAFHLAIVRAAGNPLVEVMFRAIQPYIVEILLRSLTDADVTEQGLAFHEQVARAIAAHDSDAAAAAMRDHLTLGLTLFGTDIDRDLNMVARDALGRLVTASVTLDDLLRLSHEG